MDRAADPAHAAGAPLPNPLRNTGKSCRTLRCRSPGFKSPRARHHLPSRRYGEEVMAWVKLKPGATATSKELTDYCKGKIAYFKIPSYFKFTDTYPMTVTGKIQKFKIREISTKELGLEEAAAVKTA